MAIRIVAEGNKVDPEELVMCKGCNAVLGFLPTDLTDFKGYKVVICPACSTMNVRQRPLVETPSPLAEVLSADPTPTEEAPPA